MYIRMYTYYSLRSFPLFCIKTDFTISKPYPDDALDVMLFIAVWNIESFRSLLFSSFLTIPFDIWRVSVPFSTLYLLLSLGYIIRFFKKFILSRLSYPICCDSTNSFIYLCLLRGLIKKSKFEKSSLSTKKVFFPK